MRLIDADALKDMMLQAYNDALPEFDMPWKKKMAHSVTLSFMADIDEAPTVDAVLVVCCRECILHDSCYTEDVFKFARLNDDSRFCGVGERKGGEQQ